MKLRNKLIPLAGCLAVGATVAPISLTSCTNGSSFVDLKDGFKPTTERAEISGNKLTVDEATQLYFNKIAENPEIFAQDLHWSMSMALRTIAENPFFNTPSSGTNRRLMDDITQNIVSSSTSIDSAREKVENIKVGQTTYTNSDTGKSYNRYTLSFDYVREQQLTSKLVVKAVDDDTKASQPILVNKDITGATKTTLKVSNIPFIFNRYLTRTESPFFDQDTLTGATSLYGNYVTPTTEDLHLGRCMFTTDYNVGYDYTKQRKFATDLFYRGDSETKKLLIPCEWTLFVDADCLYYTKDEFSIEYSQETEDVKTTTYNEQTQTVTESSSCSGKIGNIKDVYTMLGDYKSNIVATQLVNWCFKPYYLQNISVDGE